MNQYKILFSFCIVTAMVAGGCSKGGQAVPDYHQTDFSDSTTPVVEIYKPSNNQVFSSGDIIEVKGRVTDNGLYQGSIRITNDADSSAVKEQLYEIHGYQLYDFQLEYKATVAAVTNYTVTVQFQDHGLNTGIQTAKVKIAP